jgi:hypothetical protein
VADRPLGLLIHLDVERSLRAAEARSETIPCAPPRFPIALNAHPGAVELILGSPEDSAERELWLTAEQAEELGHDLLRVAKAARASVTGG